MAFLDTLSITGSALTATRLRMDVIAENIASINTTRTETGEPYRRKFVVFQERSAGSSFEQFYNRALGNSALGTGARSLTGTLARARASSVGGVRVSSIETDMSEFKYDYNPSHPDADEDGYVRMPNVEVVQEMVDMMAAYRAYEANITAVNTFKDMAVKTLEIGKG